MQNLMVWCGSILILSLNLKTLCSLWVLCTVCLFLVMGSGICILSLHLLWLLQVEVCLFAYSLHTFSFLGVHLVHFSWEQWLLEIPMVKCFFLWYLLTPVFLDLFLIEPIHSVLGVMCMVWMLWEGDFRYLSPFARLTCTVCMHRIQ